MTSQDLSKITHLEPSQLGTKEYWDSLYITELENHASDPTDEGTIWFSDSLAESKLLSFLQTQVEECKVLGSAVTKENCSFLDLGTGNGHFLFALRDGDEDGDGGGWEGRMMGVDYSERSVEFAKRIAEEKKFEEGREVEFRWWDFMTQSPDDVVLDGTNVEGWDVVFDKGTFDAISLSEEKDASGRRMCEAYKDRVLLLIKEGGLLLITSCNWTEQELMTWFAGHDLEYLEAVKYKSFSFGGRKGQTISSVCFRKCTSK